MSDVDTLIADARQQLAPILDYSGNILYSSVDTLRPGPVYLLGLNPGGDPAIPDTVRDMLDRLPSRTTNAYLDEQWERGSDPGQAPLQRRVRWLSEQLGIDPRRLCAANLIFTRSRSAAGCGYPELADVCWPVHLAIMGLVQPRLIIAYGNSDISPYSYLRRALPGSSETLFPSGHGSWMCRAFESTGRRVIGLPHLSRYAIDHHPEVAARILGTLHDLTRDGAVGT